MPGTATIRSDDDARATDSIAAEVAAICRRLDGLPLAIELAAARTRMLTPTQLLPRLENRLGTLTGGPRDRTPRQQTLRGAIDWSYDLLDPPARTLMARLGVFSGGADLVTIEEVCAGEDDDTVSRDAVFDLLETLANQSLLDVDDEDLHVDKAGREGGRQIVTAGLHEDQVEALVTRDQIVDRVEVGGDVVPDGGVRATTGLHGGDAPVGQYSMTAQKVGVFGGVDVVGEHRQGQLVA